MPNSASPNGPTNWLRSAQPRSPPLSLEPGSCEYCLARAAKSLPALAWASTSSACLRPAVALLRLVVAVLVLVIGRLHVRIGRCHLCGELIQAQLCVLQMRRLGCH